MARQIILASSSATRKLLLDRLNLQYIAINPEINENPKPNENAEQLAYRLSFEKANIIAQKYPNAIIIGSDQVAWLSDQPNQFIGKPYTIDAATQQLQRQSGKILKFSTGLSVQCLEENYHQTLVIPYQVKFRELSNEMIHRYLTFDEPWYCAGSFKCESLGMTLFEWLEGDDYTALMGLPVIQLCRLLRELGINLP